MEYYKGRKYQSLSGLIYRQLAGDFHNLAGQISYILAAVAAIRFGWLPRKGSQWIPDDRAVPRVFTFVATPAIAIVFAIIYRFFGAPLRPGPVAWMTGAFLFLAMAGLFTTSYLIKRFGVPVTVQSRFLGRKSEVLKVGGNRLTREAEAIRAARDVATKVLVEEAGYDVYLVFTRASIANVHSAVQASYLLFEICGPLALCGAGLLLSGDT